jgi:CelD/BcsL family acetyltransferase involved in cellulose biosynthesis
MTLSSCRRYARSRGLLTSREREIMSAVRAYLKRGQLEPAVIAELGIRDEEYGTFLRRQGAATPFHLPSWSEVIARCYGFAPSVLCLRDPNGKICAASPGMHIGGRLRTRRWVSLPFTDACPPLATGTAGAEALAAELERHRQASGLKSIEIRGDVPGGAGTRQLIGYRHVILVTEDERELFRRLSERTRRAIRRAERAGVVVRREPDLQSARGSFWRLHCVTRRKLGVPVQPRAFFDAIWQQMVERGNGYVLSGYLDSRPVASAVFLEHGPSVVYKLSAWEPSLSRLGGPSAVLWEAIRAACEKGQTLMDLGRTELHHDGLRYFKQGWGCEETLLAYTYFGTGARIEAPGPEAAVGHVIQHSPPVVARAIGRVAYRWTA